MIENRTFRIFVSSTFADFRVERGLLNDVVAPKLKELCGSFGYSFELIDLRWGISSESSLNQKTLEICLSEIERSQLFSPRPCFLIMLGGRYGWVPIPSHISTEAFRFVSKHVDDKELATLQRWYKLDENEVGGVYFLRPRQDAFTNRDTWAAEESILRNAFLKVVNIDGGSDIIGFSFVSATEHEIDKGLFDATSAADAVVLTKDSGEAPDERATVLRERVADYMKANGLEQRVLSFNEAEEAYESAFVTDVTRTLRNLIMEEIRRLDTVSEPARQESASIGLYVERSREIEALLDYVQSSNRTPLYLHGASGSGKTTLLKRLEQVHEGKTIRVSFGETANSFTLVNAVKQICLELQSDQNSSLTNPVNSQNISEYFNKAINECPIGESFLIIIDGFESFLDLADIRSNVIPESLPLHVKLIIAYADDSDCKFGFSKENVLDAGRFDAEHSLDAITQGLLLRNRRIVNERQAKTIAQVVGNGILPLQTRLITSIASRWESDAEITELPSDEEGAALLYIESAFVRHGHDSELVKYALASISVAPYGVTEDELMHLLMKYPTVQQNFAGQDRYGHNLNVLPYVMWSRLFYDLRDCLSTAVFHGAIVIRFEHDIFRRAFEKRYPVYCETARNTMIDVYLEMGPYMDADTLTSNVQRALNLPELIKKSHRDEDLERLMSNMAEIDAMAKAGAIDATILTLTEIASMSNERATREKCLDALTVLLSSRHTLACYPSGFLMLATGLNAFPRQLFRTPLALEAPYSNSIASFPYDPSSRFAPSPDGTLLATFKENWVHFWRLDSWIEFCSIFVSDKEDVATVDHVVWISNQVIAIVIRSEAIALYDVGGLLPALMGRIEFTARVRMALYSREHNVLVCLSNNKLYGISIETKAITYEIKERALSIGLSRNESLLYCLRIGGVSGAIVLRDTLNGSIVESRKGKLPWTGHTLLWLNSILEGSPDSSRSITELSNGMLATSCSGGAIIFDTDARKAMQVLPPKYESMDDSLIIGDYLVCLGVSTICVLLLTDKSKGWLYPAANPSRAVVAPDKTNLFVLAFDVISNYSIRLEDANCAAFITKNIFFSRPGSDSSWTDLPRIGSRMRRAKKLRAKDPDGWSRYESLGSSWSTTDANIARMNEATFVREASNGTLAIAYELAGAIVLYNSDGLELLRIDKLRLSVFDSMLDICFSPDSSRMLVRKTKSILIADAEASRNMILIDCGDYRIADARFASPDDLVLEFDDCAISRIDLRKLSGRTVFLDDVLSVKGLNDAASSEQYEPRIETHRVGELGLEVVYPDSFSYKSELHSIQYVKGSFYLDDSDSLLLAAAHDFARCLQEERAGYLNPLEAFVREKNDAASLLMDLDDDKLLLISRRLSSVILFDLRSLTVVNAYRHHAAIIGHTVSADKNAIVLYANRPPFRTTLFVEGIPKSESGQRD